MAHPKRPGRERSQRQLRVGELLRHEIAALLQRGDVHDPDLAGLSITITEVQVSPDLRHATAYFQTLGGREVERAEAALNRAARAVRGMLGRVIRLRYTPDVSFIRDTSFDRAEHIDALLKSERVARDTARGRDD